MGASNKILDAEEITFSDAPAGFSSASVKAAIVEARDTAPGTSSGSLPPDYIQGTYTVPLHRQMILFQRLTIAAGGRLVVNGRVRVL
jgi:hypothetical protein